MPLLIVATNEAFVPSPVSIRILGAQYIAEFTPVIWDKKDEASGTAVARSLLESGDLPTGIIAFNDRCALGLIDTMIRHGISIPSDISVIGFDDSEIASRPDINLTSVHQSPAELARFATERAIHRLDASSFPSLARGTVLPTSLTVRSSTGTVPQRQTHPRRVAADSEISLPVRID